jgi:hypothetical protein
MKEAMQCRTTRAAEQPLYGTTKLRAPLCKSGVKIPRSAHHRAAASEVIWLVRMDAFIKQDKNVLEIWKTINSPSHVYCSHTYITLPNPFQGDPFTTLTKAHRKSAHISTQHQRVRKQTPTLHWND